MLFDAAAYAATVNTMRRAGDLGKLETYLRTQAETLAEAGDFCAGASCCCGKDKEELENEDAEWQLNRTQGLITVQSDLADLYRSCGSWIKCLQTYEDLRQSLVDAGLEDTPAYSSALVNAAYACLDASDPERAANLINMALPGIENAPADAPCAMLEARAYDALAVSWAVRGFKQQAHDAAQQASAAVARTTETGEDFISAFSNHVAALAQIGQTDEALTALDGALSASDDELPQEARFTLLNLRSMVLYRSGRFAEAADTTAELIELAQHAGMLANELPSLARNASTLYNRAGNTEKAQAFQELATQLEN